MGANTTASFHGSILMHYPKLDQGNPKPTTKTKNQPQYNAKHDKNTKSKIKSGNVTIGIKNCNPR